MRTCTYTHSAGVCVEQGVTSALEKADLDISIHNEKQQKLCRKFTSNMLVLLWCCSVSSPPLVLKHNDRCFMPPLHCTDTDKEIQRGREFESDV